MDTELSKASGMKLCQGLPEAFLPTIARGFFMVSENAKRIEINLDRFHFFVVKHEKQFFIPTNEGLRLINVNIDWISGLGNRRKRTLERYGFSFKEQLICYEIEGRSFFGGSYSWSDWLRLWSYFASKGNSSAVRLLRVLAELGTRTFN
jgi:hypothetical protein